MCNKGTYQIRVQHISLWRIKFCHSISRMLSSIILIVLLSITTVSGQTACTPGLMYCSEKLKEMGYTSMEPNSLYECGSDCGLSFYNKCPYSFDCTTRETYSFCPVYNGTKYCGYELKLFNDRRRHLDHALHSSNGVQLETCSGRCASANFSDDGGSSRCVDDVSSTCTVGQKYCGLQLTWQTFETWAPHTLFECTTGNLNINDMRVVENCKGGCTIGNPSQCKETGIASPKPDGAVCNPTTPAPTTPSTTTTTTASTTTTTTVPTTTTTVITSPPKYCCIPGKFYCGRQLAEWGYTNAVAQVLYECSSDSNGYFVHHCTTACRDNGDNSYCQMHVGQTACGFSLRLFNVPVSGLSDDTLYRGTGPDTVEVLQSCPFRCWTNYGAVSKCVPRGNNLCSRGKQYCGYKMLSTTDIKSWQHHMLYVCSGGNLGTMRPIHRCPGGCADSIEPNVPQGRCIDTRTSYKPVGCQPKSG